MAGCSEQTDGWLIHGAVNVCKDHDGVDYIKHVIGRVQCTDGTEYRFSAIKQKN